MEKFYITTPIYYPSANFHIGHCYTTIIADSIARYNKLIGKDVFFLTGTDEHGEKIQKKAEIEGISPKEYVDKIVENAKDLWKCLDIEYTKFIRTTDEYHEEAVKKIFNKLYNQGDIYKGEYEGLYCTPCESFWTETQLVDGKCPDCGRDVHIVKEESYFFRLSKYQDRILDYISNHPDFIQPESRKNEMINNFLKPGLEDVCVSRTTFNWGIPITFDPKHVVYVWIDALTNYITALGYMSEDDSNFKKYWPANLHLVGKEIVRFHTIIWPAILMALDLPLPEKIFGHGWLIIDGGKMSKSLGNYKDPREYINKYGSDSIRYFSLREVPFGNDGSFSVSSLISRINSDLANILGNLLNRTISMSKKYFNGLIINEKVYDKIDDDLINYAENLYKIVDNNMNNLHISDALESIFELLRKCNKYIDETTPWILAKNDENKGRLGTVLYNLLECLRISSILLSPFIPNTSKEIFKQLNTKNISYDSCKKFGGLELGSYVGEPKPLFKRFELEEEK